MQFTVALLALCASVIAQRPVYGPDPNAPPPPPQSNNSPQPPQQFNNAAPPPPPQPYIVGPAPYVVPAPGPYYAPRPAPAYGYGPAPVAYGPPVSGLAIPPNYIQVEAFGNTCSRLNINSRDLPL
jgi:hypothetical protein